MADNWADTPIDPQDARPDEGDEEADANNDPRTNNPNVNDDANDDGTKPKRARAPTLPNIDDGLDEPGDDPPKPKRGRGRPKKDDDPNQLAIMRKELEDMRHENEKLCVMLRNCNSEKDDLEKDLELTRSSLLERESDYTDLLDQLSNHEENFASQSTPKPNGIVFFDDITECLISKLKPSINWNKIKKGISDIDESDGIKDADIVLIVTGSSEIATGTTAFHLHQALRRTLNKYCEDTQFYVTSLPPNNSARVQIDLYNHKLANLDIKNSCVLKLKFIGSKLDLVNFNGTTPSPKCISMFDEILQSITVPTVVKSKRSAATSDSSFEVTAIMQIKPVLVGRIIGKNGNVIKRITTDCDVRISFGSWKERNSESKEDDADSFTAAMIKGLSANVNRAMDQINVIIKSDKK